MNTGAPKHSVCPNNSPTSRRRSWATLILTTLLISQVAACRVRTETVVKRIPIVVPCLPGSSEIPKTPTYRVDGPRDGCQPPYATCTRGPDARKREIYLRKLERLRDVAIACQRWAQPGAEATDENKPKETP